MTTSIKAWSYSALTNFESCPKKFWHYRIKKDYKDEGGEASRYGDHVHKSINNYLVHNVALPLDLVHMQKVVDVYKNMKSDRLISEQQLAINSDYEPTGWFDKDVYCRAIIDAIFIHQDLALLVDWKTGKMKDDGATQLRLAACILMLHIPEVNKVAMRYVWLAHKGKTTNFTMTRKDMPAVWNELSPRLRRYQHAHAHDEFPASPSGLCRKWCNITSCPHHGG
jgi:hypothetical protein